MRPGGTGPEGARDRSVRIARCDGTNKTDERGMKASQHEGKFFRIAQPAAEGQIQIDSLNFCS